MRRLFLFAAVCALSWCAVTGTALASDVSDNSGTLDYFAASGETNNLTISLGPSGFVVDDPGATITPGTGCVANGIHGAICNPTDIDAIDVSLGDMNDQGRIDSSVPPLGNEVFDDPSVEMEGDQGSDTVIGGPRTTNQLWGDFNDFGESGTDGADVVTGGDRFDQLVGGGGNDQLNGGGADDELFGGGGNDVMNGNDGNDRFETAGAPDGADVINGGRDIDRYDADGRTAPLHITLDGVPDDGEGCPGPACEGDNVQPDVEEVNGGSADDVIVAGPGAQDLNGGQGNDTIDAGGGDDSLFGGRGNDILHGGAGADTIFGVEGADQQFGDAGDDLLLSTETDDDPDLISGGGGTDEADYTDANSAVRITLDNKANDGVAGEGDNVRADTEDVLGSLFNDVLVGNNAANQLVGNDGNDRLVGKAGADGLIGGRGADVLNAGKGADFLDGGAAPDRLNSRDGKADEVDCGSSFDRVKGDRVDHLAGDCDKASLKGRR